MHSHHGSSWDKGCHNPVLKEMGVFFHLGLALAVQCHNSFGRSLQVPPGWLWLRLAFSWRRIQVCQGRAGSSATGDSWICRGGLSPSRFRSSGTNSPWECCCSFPAAEVGHAVSGSRRNVEAGTAWIVAVLVPSLLQKSGEAPPKIISHGWLQSHGGSSRSQQQAERAVGWHGDRSLRMRAVPGPQRKRRCQPKELDWKPSVPPCSSAGAKKQHVLALRGCSRNVLSFPNRKKRLEITRDSGLGNTEGRGCCGVKGEAKGLSSVSLIPQKALGNVVLIQVRCYTKLGWFHSTLGGQKFRKGKSNQYREVFGLKSS